LKKVYLNNAATSYPKPISVLTAVNEYLSKPPFHSARAGFENVDNDITTECRNRLAKLFNVNDANRIIFTSGSTESLNLAILGSEFNNAHIITTNTEHNSVLRPLKTLEREKRISLSIVASDTCGSVSPDDIEKEINSKTSAIVINHASNVTGIVQDLKSISEIANKYNLRFIVDASQSAGVIDIDFTGLNIDLLAFTGHKSLFGLQGIGGLIIKEGITLKPIKFGGTGIRSDYLYQPEDLPLFYEAGTPNMPGIVSLNEGCKYIEKTGMISIANHKKELTGLIRNSIDELPSVRVLDLSEKNNLAIINLMFYDFEPEDASYILEQSFGIVTRSGLHCAPLIHISIGSNPLGTVRISPSHFNTIDDIQYLIDSIKIICEGRGF
jgi:cysteine desulfurase family protein